MTATASHRIHCTSETHTAHHNATTMAAGRAHTTTRHTPTDANKGTEEGNEWERRNDDDYPGDVCGRIEAGDVATTNFTINRYDFMA